jgi:hypothetical protein
MNHVFTQLPCLWPGTGSAILVEHQPRQMLMGWNVEPWPSIIMNKKIGASICIRFPTATYKLSLYLTVIPQTSSPYKNNPLKESGRITKDPYNEVKTVVHGLFEAKVECCIHHIIVTIRPVFFARLNQSFPENPYIPKNRMHSKSQAL